MTRFQMAVPRSVAGVLTFMPVILCGKRLQRKSFCRVAGVESSKPRSRLPGLRRLSPDHNPANTLAPRLAGQTLTALSTQVTNPVLHAARAFFRGCRFCFLTARAWTDYGEAAGWEALSP